jgi:hypothetical protein
MLIPEVHEFLPLSGRTIPSYQAEMAQKRIPAVLAQAFINPANLESHPERHLHLACRCGHIGTSNRIGN